MAHNHSNGKNHKKQKHLRKGKMKPKKLFKEPTMPRKKADEAPHGQERPCAGELKTTPSKKSTTPTLSSPPKTPNSVASRANAVGSAIAKKLTPASRKTASIAGSPSPSPLRWVSFPVKRGGNIKGVRLFADDRPPVVIPATPSPVPDASKVLDAAPSTDARSPSDADSVKIGSLPTALNMDTAGLGDASQRELVTEPPQILSGDKNAKTSEDGKASEDAKAKRRGPAGFMRQAGRAVVSGGACIKRGVKAGAVKIWAGIKRQAQCACFVRGATKD